jgi:Phytochelatin synthase
MLDCCAPLATIQSRGITFTEFACLAKCNGLAVASKRWHTGSSFRNEFYRDIQLACASDDQMLVIAFDRVSLNQTGNGHFSPIGAYHLTRNLVLVLDVARFKVNACCSLLPAFLSYPCSIPPTGHPLNYCIKPWSRWILTRGGRAVTLCSRDCKSSIHFLRKIWSDSMRRRKNFSLCRKSFVPNVLPNPLMICACCCDPSSSRTI